MGVNIIAELYYGFSFKEEEEREDTDILKKICNILDSNENESNMISIDLFCDLDYPIYYVCVTASKFTAYSNEPVSFGLQLPVRNPNWDRQIEDFCRKNSLPYRTPGWEMVSLSA